MPPALCLIFFLSGAAALLFETLWFRLAGLTFGNSVWASSLVLASFMGGLALGNGLAARGGPRLGRPIRLYALLEVAIGIAGFSLVLLFPAMTDLLAPAFRRFLDTPWILNPLRLLIAFGLMVVPSSAMGATLPILVKALSKTEPDFGRVLGRLYGWNTLGAMAGALAGEAFLIERLGLRGTGSAAALLNGLAALGALALSRRRPASEPAPMAAAPPHRLGSGAKRLLAAAFLAGGTLLALEVVWFRFLLLFVRGTSLTFAVMLSVVLLGIAAGGLAASWWLGREPDAHRFAPVVALLAGWASLIAYVGFGGSAGPHAVTSISQAGVVFSVSLRLMFPASLASGVLFTLLGRALREEMDEETRTAGTLTLANTMGAMCGALLAGFVLLPRLGMEMSFFALGLAYGGVACFGLKAGLSSRPRSGGESWALRSAGALLGLFLALFPFGLMRNHYIPSTVKTFTGDGSRVVALREGLTETILYLRKDLWEEPLYHRLVTNGFSMSASQAIGRRYMKLFVYWPIAVHPTAKRALLISYGVGSTAKALTDTAGLKSIDVVDTSPDILEMGRIVFPSPASHPLNDPRVRVHVEDGRFFLQTTPERFDLITGEPPPPKNAGIVNLYSREYFQLIHDRLADGGITTYWLPVSVLRPSDTKAIVKGFCSVFRDCSLWTGATLNWMLVGTRGARGPVLEGDFVGQWRDAAVAPEMRALGLEAPEQLGATFLADAAFLEDWTQEQSALVDDYPYRLSPLLPPDGLDPLYLSLMDTRETKKRFERSALVQRLWPPSIARGTLDSFEDQRVFNDYVSSYYSRKTPDFATLVQVLTRSPRRSLALWLMDSDEDTQRLVDRALAKGVADSYLDYQLGARAMADRDYLGAERHFREAQSRGPGPVRLAHGRIVALCLAGDLGKAGEVALGARGSVDGRDPDPAFWAWLEATFGLAVPDPTPQDVRAP